MTQKRLRNMYHFLLDVSYLKITTHWVDFFLLVRPFNNFHYFFFHHWNWNNNSDSGMELYAHFPSAIEKPKHGSMVLWCCHDIYLHRTLKYIRVNAFSCSPHSAVVVVVIIIIIVILEKYFTYANPMQFHTSGAAWKWILFWQLLLFNSIALIWGQFIYSYTDSLLDWRCLSFNLRSVWNIVSVRSSLSDEFYVRQCLFLLYVYKKYEPNVDEQHTSGKKK